MWPEHPTLPYIIHWSFRKERLCVPSGCDDQIEVRDERGFLVRRERCAACPLDQLDRAVAEHPVLTRAFDLDFALTTGIKLTLEDLDCEEFRALKILRIERDRFQAEQIKNNRPIAS